MSAITPYMRGHADGLAGKPGPAFPTPDSSWAERLYNRGWSDGTDARLYGERKAPERAALTASGA